MLTLTTPTLDPPSGIDGKTLRAFWLNLGKAPFRFHLRATDLAGQIVTFDASAIFVKDDGVTNMALMDAIRNAYDSPTDPTYTVSALAGQKKMAFTSSRNPNAGDTTLQVESLRFRSGSRPTNARQFVARLESGMDPVTGQSFTVPRAMWETSIAGGSFIGAITGPPSIESGNVTIVPHERGAVLAVSGVAPQPLPQAVFNAWSAQNAAGNWMGAPTGFAYPTSGGKVFPFQFGDVTLNDAGVASVTEHVESDPRRYLQPKDNVVGLLPPQGGTTAKAIIGGDAALAQMAADIAGTSGGADFIYILSWHCNVDFELIPGDPASTLRSLLSSRASAGVQIRAMLWAGDPIPPPSGAVSFLFGDLVNSPWQLAKDYARLKTSRSVNEPAVKFINGLSTSGNDAAAILDDRHLLAGSHHQKVVLIGTGGKLVAYVGGIEFNRDRIPPPLENEPGSPLFDIAVRLQDAGASCPCDFLGRWTLHPDRRGAPLRVASLSLPLPTGGPLAVQITHTYGRGFPFAATAVKTASTALANGIKSARGFFYIEDQYFVGSPKMADAIRDALSANLFLVGIVVIAAEDSVSDLPDVGFRRRAFIGQIATAFPGRLLVFERLGSGSTKGATAYVHSKLVIVDDEVAFIGSVNSNRRSWFHDSEIDATIVDTTGPGGTTLGTRGWARNLRCELWSRHLNVSTALLGDWFVDVGLWRGVLSGRTSGTSVRPYDLAAVPRYRIKGVVIVPDAVLDKAWDTLEDPT